MSEYKQLTKQEQQFVDNMIKELLDAGYSFEEMVSIFKEAGRQYKEYKKRKQKKDI